MLIRPAAAEIEQLLDAIAVVESGNRNLAYGDRDSVGVYQLRQIFVDDVNRILGKPTFTHTDRLNPAKSRQMARIYLAHYCKGMSIEQMARCFNGGPQGHKKPSTIRYWQKIKAILNEKTRIHTRIYL